MTKNQKAIFCMLLAGVLFSLTEVAMKKINADLNGVQVNATRYFLCGVFLMPWSRARLKAMDTHIHAAQMKLCALLAFSGITIVGPLYQMASATLGAGNTGVIFSSTPLFIIMLAALLLHTPVTRREGIALALQVLAIAILVDPFHMTMDPVGVASLLVCVVCYSLYAVGGKKLITDLGSITVTAWSFFWGGVQLLLVAGLSHIPAVSQWLMAHGFANYACVPLFTGYTWENLPWVLVLYIGITLVAFLSWFLAIEWGGVALGSLTYFIKPALSPLFALIFAGEPITTKMMIGMVLMIGEAFVALKR